MLSPTQVTWAYSRSTLLQSILNDSTRRSRIIFQLKKTWSWPKVRFPFGWLKKVRPRLGSQVKILFLALWFICRRFTIFMDFYLVNEKGFKKEKDFLVKVSRARSHRVSRRGCGMGLDERKGQTLWKESCLCYFELGLEENMCGGGENVIRVSGAWSQVSGSTSLTFHGRNTWAVEGRTGTREISSWRSSLARPSSLKTENEQVASGRTSS